MSNSLAVATVTATLQNMLTSVAKRAITGASASVGRPQEIQVDPNNGASTPRVNIYLYQATPNPDLRNADLPARRPDGTLVERPKAALDLHYLFSYYGDEGLQEPERLMGEVVAFFHSQPVITKDRMEAAIADALNNIDPNHYLKDSDLPDQIEKVRLTPIAMNLEELSKLWSVFFQTKYTLSTAYRASVVLVENRDESPQQALPVQAANVYAVTFQHPKIQKITALTGQDDPIFFDSTIVIAGSQLRGPITRVRIAGSDQTPDPQKTLATRIEIPLPAGLSAGVQPLQIVHKHMMGTPPVEHDGVESNVFPFVLRPKIVVDTPSVSDGKVKLTFTPLVKKDQRVVLFLNQLNALPGDTPLAYSFKAPKDNGITDPLIKETDKITFEASGVANGVYLVRVQVDGAESTLTYETNPASPDYMKYTGPTVTFT